MVYGGILCLGMYYVVVCLEVYCVIETDVARVSWGT